MVGVVVVVVVVVVVGGGGVKAVKTDPSPGRACAPPVQADAGSSRPGPAHGELSSVCARRRQSSLLGQEMRGVGGEGEEMRPASTQRDVQHHSALV